MKFKVGQKVYSIKFDRYGVIIEVDVFKFDLRPKRAIYHSVRFTEYGETPHNESTLIDAELLETRLWKVLA